MSSFSCLNFHNSTKMGIKDQYASATCRMTLQSAVISWRRRNAVCSGRLPGCPPAHAHKEPLSVFGHDIHPFPFFSTILVWLSSPSFFFFLFQCLHYIHLRHITTTLKNSENNAYMFHSPTVTYAPSFGWILFLFVIYFDMLYFY